MSHFGCTADCSGFLFVEKKGQDGGIPKERWFEFEGIGVINLAKQDFSSLMRSCAETQALKSLSQGQTSSLSSCDSLLKDAMRLWEECISKAVLALLFAGQTNFPKRRNSLGGEGWRQLSHHMRSWQITPIKGMHRSV